jgi:'Cold-shock' DNA-binding domain
LHQPLVAGLPAHCEKRWTLPLFWLPAWLNFISADDGTFFEAEKVRDVAADGRCDSDGACKRLAQSVIQLVARIDRGDVTRTLRAFVHISAVERAGLSSLNEGQVVEYEEVSNKGKTSAENLKVQR